MRDDRPFGFAGCGNGGKAREVNKSIHAQYSRLRSTKCCGPYMTACLSEDDELWLDSDVRDMELGTELLSPYPASEMVSYLVGASINSPRNQCVELIEQMNINSA